MAAIVFLIKRCHMLSTPRFPSLFTLWCTHRNEGVHKISYPVEGKVKSSYTATQYK